MHAKSARSRGPRKRFYPLPPPRPPPAATGRRSCPHRLRLSTDSASPPHGTPESRTLESWSRSSVSGGGWSGGSGVWLPWSRRCSELSEVGLKAELRAAGRRCWEMGGRSRRSWGQVAPGRVGSSRRERRSRGWAVRHRRRAPGRLRSRGRTASRHRRTLRSPGCRRGRGQTALRHHPALRSPSPLPSHGRAILRHRSRVSGSERRRRSRGAAGRPRRAPGWRRSHRRAVWLRQCWVPRSPSRGRAAP